MKDLLAQNGADKSFFAEIIEVIEVLLQQKNLSTRLFSENELQEMKFLIELEFSICKGLH